jgi:hypothetical protein
LKLGLQAVSGLIRQLHKSSNWLSGTFSSRIIKDRLMIPWRPMSNAVELHSVSLASPRIAKHEKVSAHRRHLQVKLSEPGEVDAELMGWLAEAFVLQQ